MRVTHFVILALLAASTAFADPGPEAWSPLRPFIGSWSGLRTGGAGSQKIVRQVESGVLEAHIKILDRVRGRDEVRGVIRFDGARQGLVLRAAGAGGEILELPFDAAASNDSRLVFGSLTSGPGSTLVSYERQGWNQFVERVEHASNEGRPELVSEVRFRRSQ